METEQDGLNLFLKNFRKDLFIIESMVSNLTYAIDRQSIPELIQLTDLLLINEKTIPEMHKLLNDVYDNYTK